MPSLPIAPDESGGEPRCRRECPSATPSVTCDCCIDCAEDHDRHEVGTLCLPRVRELVALSRRRCDGCRHWTALAETERGFCESIAAGHTTHPEESCSRWEART